MRAPLLTRGTMGCRMTKSEMVQGTKIGVVTVTYNSELVIREFLDSLRKQTLADFVLYLVDNASKDRTLEIVRQCSELSIVVIANAENLGVAEGNNQGIRAALADDCECVLLLNNDTTFPPDFLTELYDGLDRFHCEMTTCKMYFHNEPDRIWCAGGRFRPLLGYDNRHAGEGERDMGQFDDPRPIDYTPSCCLMVRRNVFDQIGLMDSRYFCYSDDSDFLYRCLQRNIPLWYIPEARLWHKVSSLTGNMSDFTVRYMTRNRIYFVRKHFPYWLALLWYGQAQFRTTVAFLALHINSSTMALRLRSARDGWKMLDR